MCGLFGFHSVCVRGMGRVYVFVASHLSGAIYCIRVRGLGGPVGVRYR